MGAQREDGTRAFSVPSVPACWAGRGSLVEALSALKGVGAQGSCPVPWREWRSLSLERTMAPRAATQHTARGPSLCASVQGSKCCQRGRAVPEAAAGPPRAGASVADGPGAFGQRGQPPSRVAPSWGCAASAAPPGAGCSGPPCPALRRGEGQLPQIASDFNPLAGLAHCCLFPK